MLMDDTTEFEECLLETEVDTLFSWCHPSFWIVMQINDGLSAPDFSYFLPVFRFSCRITLSPSRLRFPFSVPHSLLSCSPFSVLRSPFSVLRSPISRILFISHLIWKIIHPSVAQLNLAFWLKVVTKVKGILDNVSLVSIIKVVK